MRGTSRPSIGARLAPVLGLDPRGLAALRIGLGGALLVDLWMRTGKFRALYTDEGVFPRAFLDPPMLVTVAPLHLLGGSFAWAALLFGAAFVFAVLLLLGLFTRLASVASWFLVVSIQSRQPLVLNFGDDLIRLSLFWAMFLPLGTRWSLDARRRLPAAGPRAPVCNVATAAFQLQIAFVYFFTAMFKSGADWRETGLALFYALHLDAWVTPFGVWLRQFVAFTRVLTFSTLILEFVGPFLLFAPVWWIRTLTVLAFLGLHLGIAASYRLGIFPWVDLVVLLPFFPAPVWDRVERLVSGATPPAVTPAAQPGAASPGRRIRQAAIAVPLLYVFAYNVDGVHPLGLPRWATETGYWLRLNQKWLMFTPNASRVDGWWVIPGTLADGRQIDLSLHGPDLTWQKPASISAENEPFRWALYMAQMSDAATNVILRVRWADWRCRDWNRTHSGPERLEKLDMYFMLEETLDVGLGVRLTKRFMLSRACPAEGAS